MVVFGGAVFGEGDGKARVRKYFLEISGCLQLSRVPTHYFSRGRKMAKKNQGA